MLNGRTTYSPTCTLSTPSPTSTTWPRFSCPNQRPGSKSVRPSYMCRSEPQMFADVIRTRTSVGRSIRASGTSLTLTCRGPSYTTAFMLPPLCRCVPSPGPSLRLHLPRLDLGIGRHAYSGPDGSDRTAFARTRAAPAGRNEQGPPEAVGEHHHDVQRPRASETRLLRAGRS